MPGHKLFDAESESETLIVVPLGNVRSLAEENVKPELDGILEQLRGPGVRNVVLDCEKIPYFGTTMLEAMLAIWRCARAREGKMALCNVSDIAREILGVSKFDTLWPICSSREEALRVVSE